MPSSNHSRQIISSLTSELADTLTRVGVASAILRKCRDKYAAALTALGNVEDIEKMERAIALLESDTEWAIDCFLALMAILLRGEGDKE